MPQSGYLAARRASAYVDPRPSGFPGLSAGSTTVSRERIRESLETIGSDRVRGARELVLALARALAPSLRELSDDELSRGREDLARWIVEAQPEMAPFYHLAALVLEEGSTAAETAVLLERFAGGIETDATVEHGAAAVPEDGVVATYSRSGSVRAALELAATKRGRVTVLVGEGRPGYEGRSLASDLAAAGLGVELMSDAGLLARLGDADRALLGADAVGAAGFRNKVGTRAFCVAARDLGVPIYVIADATKLLPEPLWPSTDEREASEVWDEAPSGVRVRNPYFERTPLDRVDGLVTDDGTLSPGDVERRVARVADRFQRLRRLLESTEG